MYGGPGDDSLTGGPRADRLDGGNGADGLSGGGGRDLYQAGAGSDELAIGRRRANGAAHIACGPGRDLIVSLSAQERPPRDCERMLVRRLGTGAAVVVADRAVRVGRKRALVRLSCTRRAPRRVCRGTIVIRRVAGGRLVRAGARSYRIGRGRSARILVRLSRASLRTLRTRRSLELRVSAWNGSQFGIEWTVGVSRATPAVGRR